MHAPLVRTVHFGQPRREGRAALWLFVALAAAGLTTPTTRAAKAAERPNFVVILADDLGWGDLACYESAKIKTPNLDRLAQQGTRFTDHYAGAPNCSPSRTGLMTGRTPFRVGVYNWIPEPSPMHLRASEVTVATLLKRAGYATCHVGKWHLNGLFNSNQQPQPSDHGFEHWFSTQNNAIPSHHAPRNFVRDGQPVGPLEGYSSTIIVDEATRWLDGRDTSKPFFLYVCFHSPHEPIATAQEYLDMYADESDPRAAELYGNVTQLDHEAGRLLDHLDKLGLRDSTCVLFTSDNGPAITPAHPFGSAGHFRDKKGSVWEGGIREPMIVRWPGHVPVGQVSDQPMCHTDLLPTVCDIVGIEAPTDRRIDGESVLPALLGQDDWRRAKPIFWEFDRATGGPKVALRDGDWKLLGWLDEAEMPPANAGGARERDRNTGAKLTRFELFNLKDDPGETTDRAANEPARLADMTAAMTRLFDEIRAEGPVWPVDRSPAPKKKKAGGNKKAKAAAK